MTDGHDPYAAFARWYDLEFADFEDDRFLYLQFAREAGGPVLELGCGTGRILRVLSETGLPLTGIDNSAAMLAIARDRVSSDVTLVQCDMREIDETIVTTGPFWLAFSAINSFLHLPDTESQMAALGSIAKLVVPGGLLLLDLMVPDPAYLVSLDGRVMHELSAILPDGTRLEKWVSRTHSLAEQTIETSVWFDTARPEDGRVTRTAGKYLTRYIHRFELEHLLARSGWRMISLYGSYDLDPFDSQSERMIALATRGETVPTRED